MRYTMLDMGLGELAAHVLLWTLWYLRDQGELVLLLDEPDAYFPPRSREPLLDHIGTTAATRNQAFVLTTHSREALERAISHPIVARYVARTRDGIVITSESNEVRRIVQTVLYPKEGIELAAWVEDESRWSSRKLCSSASIPRSCIARSCIGLAERVTSRNCSNFFLAQPRTRGLGVRFLPRRQ